MAAYWDELRSSVEAFLPADIAGYETQVIAVAVTTTVLAFILLLWLVCGGGRRGRGKYVCLLGLSNSGKTLLFLRLIYGQYRETQVSIKENKASYTPNNKGSVELVDIPGDERVRQRVFNKYKDSLRAVLVVIDSDNLPNDIHGLAELLYDLFLEQAVYKGRTPVLIVCNKQDLPLAKDGSSVKKHLEKEISSLRVSRSAKLSSLGSKGRSNVSHLGVEGKTDFEFSDLPKAVSVEFIECSARGQDSKSEIEHVTTWIDQHC